MAPNNKISGREYHPHLLLADFLRDYMGLTGAKAGCNSASCDVCMVWAGGKSLMDKSKSFENKEKPCVPHATILQSPHSI